jgi:hypothetical protein
MTRHAASEATSCRGNRGLTEKSCVSILWRFWTAHGVFVEGRKYTVVVFLKGGQKKYFTGTFVGYSMVHGTRKTPTEGVISTIGKNTVIPETAGKVYLTFKGAHSTLLYKANTDWLIIEA